MRRTWVLAGCLGLVAGGAVPAMAQAAPLHRPFAQVETGMRLSATGLRYEDIYRIKSSPFGHGGAVQDATLTAATFPTSAKAVTTFYYGDGRLTTNETLTVGAPDVDGIGRITGTGICANGTFKHQGETCTYAIKGYYSLVTGQVSLALSGTYTPMTTKKTTT